MIEFRSSAGQTQFNDPRRGFEPVAVQTELRIDPLTGAAGRVAHLGFSTGDRTLPEVVRQNAIPVFCPPMVHEITPTFPPDVVPEGRLVRGRSVLFPNLNPYEVYSPVVAVGDRPYVEPDGLATEDVADALALLRELFGRLPSRVAASGVVGWNYLPAAGSSIPHPHMQAIASGRTPDRQRQERRGELRYIRRNRGSFWDDLVAAERGGPRWLGASRRWSALAAFCSRSVIPETWLVHRSATDLVTASDAALSGLAEWACRLAAAHHAEGVSAFNLIIHPVGRLRPPPSRLRARFIPRLALVEATSSSDVFWIQMGTEEGMCAVFPEEWAATLRARLSPG